MTLPRLIVVAAAAAAIGTVGIAGGLAKRDGARASAAQTATVGAPAVQASDVHAYHRNGQTLITWKEAIALVTDPAASVPAVQQIQKQIDARMKIRYRIYRANRPITSLDGLTPIGEALPLSGWNTEFYGVYPTAGDRALRYVVTDGGAPVAPDTGVFAFNPSAVGTAYYAVSVSIDGRENRTIGANVLAAPIDETVGPGEPILQRVEKPETFQYIDHPRLEYYVRWEVPPNVSVAGRPFDYLVALPPNRKLPSPVGIHMHAWGGHLTDGYGWWFNGQTGAVLISANEIPYDWWTGYPDRWGTGERLETRDDWRRATVHPYTQRRLLSFVKWATTKYTLDSARLFTAGISMGGSGSLMMAIRHPETVAWAVSWVGLHVPSASPQFAGSYAAVYGDPAWKVPFEDGTPVWDYFDDVKYLRSHVGTSTGLLVFANGKNDAAIGWSQAVEFLRALQETHQPHLFVWGQDGHGQRTLMPADGGERIMPLDLTITSSLPAFSRGSLDDDPGNGDPAVGAPKGQVNQFLTWDTKSVQDEADRWQVHVAVTPSAPKETCTVDITPRRTRGFRPAAGERVHWVNTPAGGGKSIQEGDAVVDRWGVVTLDQVVVGKKGNRVTVSRQASSTQTARSFN